MVRNGEATRVVLKPGGTGSIRGTIRWEQLLPRRLLHVTASRKDRPRFDSEGEGLTSRTVFAIDGQFYLDGLGDGTWEVETFAWSDDERLFVGNADVTIEHGEAALIQLDLAEE